MRLYGARPGRLFVCVAVVVGALVLGFGGPAVYRWVDARSAEKAAVSMATDLGLQLSDDDSVLYSETYPSFPDSSAFLVIESNSPERAANLRTDSGLISCAPTVSYDPDQVPSGFRPASSEGLVACESPVTGRGYLRAVWSPTAGHDNRMFLSAIQM
ncbi:hypothetical protein CPI83_29130 (plasmid) [Rhodococcus sp. H-CA8f]|nr:hypothetical protein CPI83_29130 [Rhodococcus sp. H-CA8f]